MADQKSSANTEEKELTGIERELVLQYLRDGKAPVTVSLEDKPEQSEAEIGYGNLTPVSADERIAPSDLFPVAVQPDQFEMLEQGILLLNNMERTMKPFVGKNVRVQFYFNKVGLYFLTTMKEYSKGLAVVVPRSVKRIPDVEVKVNYDFEGTITYTSEDEQTVSIHCVPLRDYPLFVKPVWSSVPEEKQQECKTLLEKFVYESKHGMGSPIGNGLHLIPISRYLVQDFSMMNEAVIGKIKPMNIIYVDHEKMIVASTEEGNVLEIEGEYSMEMSFLLVANTKLKRKVRLQFTVENIFASENSSSNKCYMLRYTEIKKEDLRFLHDKMTSV